MSIHIEREQILIKDHINSNLKEIDIIDEQ